MDYDQVSRTVRWSRTKIIDMIRDAAHQGRPLTAKSFPGGFFAATIDYFGTWEAAVSEAGYGDKSWQQADVGLRNNIRKYRKAAGLSETELGRRLGVSHRTISMLELGQYVDPRVSFAIRLSRELGCTVEDLFEIKD